jgi:hypothetical protein
MVKVGGFLAVTMVTVTGWAALAAPPPGAAPTVATPQASAARGDRTSASAEALTRGNTMEALSRADEAIRADAKNAWAHYNRAAALAAMNRIDDAVAAYDEATAKFGNDKRGRSLALWGKGHVLYRVGRCNEASQAFSEYAKILGSSDPQSTALASERASNCRPTEGRATETAARTAAPAPASTPATATKRERATATEPSLAPKPEGESKSALPSLTTPTEPAPAPAAANTAVAPKSVSPAVDGAKADPAAVPAPKVEPESKSGLPSLTKP